MFSYRIMLFILGIIVSLCLVNRGDCAGFQRVINQVTRINEEGPYLGIVVPNNFEMGPLLRSPSFVPDRRLPYFDISGRRFRIGTLENKKVIIIMTGLGMLNAGIATELLLALFRVKGVLHFGIAGNANPNLQIGDVTIPQSWAHIGLWNWQRYGEGPDDELALESNGDYTRKIGYLKFSEYNNGTNVCMSNVDNFLNNVWYQPEEVFPVDGQPEVRQHAFWVPVNNHYFSLSKKLEGMKLERCLNTTACLPRVPIVTRVERGVSANVFVDNAAYREFIRSRFNATPIDMETAAVALICLQQKTPFIAIRALSDLAGGGSAMSNEAAIFASLASQNAVSALLRFISLLDLYSPSTRYILRTNYGFFPRPHI